MATRAQPIGAPRRPRRWADVISFVLLLLTGLAMAAPGLYLAVLGGSLYYLVAGAAVTASGLMMLGRPRAGRRLFAASFLATAVWGLSRSAPMAGR